MTKLKNKIFIKNTLKIHYLLNDLMIINPKKKWFYNDAFALHRVYLKNDKPEKLS